MALNRAKLLLSRRKTRHAPFTHSFYSLVRLLRRYQAQVTLLTSLLRPKYGLALEIGTVDGMQGREKEAVIISLVRSNNTVRPPVFLFIFFIYSPSDSIRQRDVGFLKEKKRMNGACWVGSILCLGLFSYLFTVVAMTRAKRHLVSLFFFWVHYLFTRQF